MTTTTEKSKDKTKKQNETKTTNTKTNTIIKRISSKTKTKIKTNTTKKTNITKKTKKTPKYANHPDYQYDTIKKRWVKKSDIRPIQLVNKYQKFLMEYLKTHTHLEHKEIDKIVRKYATSTDRLYDIFLTKNAMTEQKATEFLNKNDFWHEELCKHMKKICPTETDLTGLDWCEYDESAFCYYKDKKTKLVSCYSVNDILDILSSTFTGGGEETILLQPPRDPYTRKVLSEDFFKKYLKEMRRLKYDNFGDAASPHTAYFLRNYKKFYADPKIKPYLNKNTLTNQEKWKLSDAIEDFLTRTNEIRHGWDVNNNRWWFWVSGKKPADKFEYIYNN